MFDRLDLSAEQSSFGVCHFYDAHKKGRPLATLEFATEGQGISRLQACH